MRVQMRGSDIAGARRRTHLVAILGFALLLARGCNKHPQQPSIEITRVPPAGAGGPQKLDFIAGSVHGAKPNQQIVPFAYAGVWWAQPYAAQPSTKILPDGSWKNSTHLGTQYAAVLADASYTPPEQSSALAQIGSGIYAVEIVNGAPGPAIVEKKIHFSGYDWLARSAGSDRGGEANDYDPENEVVDPKGFLHLRMQTRNGRWTCAEVNLTHSLGYGTYTFVVQDSVHLSPSAVVGLFTWDLAHSDNFQNEIDVELGRWGDPKIKNAQYVIQPYYVPANVFRFEVPSGVVTYSFRWESGKVTFTSIRGADASGRPIISRHVFTSGIPAPATEKAHDRAC